MITINKLIEEIENTGWKSATDDAKIYVDSVKDIIHRHLDGYLIVPEGWAKAAKCPDFMCIDGAVVDSSACQIERCQFCYEKSMISAKGESNE